jgi:hypothetical protein
MPGRNFIFIRQRYADATRGHHNEPLVVRERLKESRFAVVIGLPYRTMKKRALHLRPHP